MDDLISTNPKRLKIRRLETSDDSLQTGKAESDARNWYVIHCYSGYEKAQKSEQRIETMSMKDKIFGVVIPTQEEIEVRDGKRRTVERHVFGLCAREHDLEEESFVVQHPWRDRPVMGDAPTRCAPKRSSRSCAAWKTSLTYRVTYAGRPRAHCGWSLQ